MTHNRRSASRWPRSLAAVATVGALLVVTIAGSPAIAETNPPADETVAGTTDPGTTDPGTTDPGTTDPGTTDPGTTDPGTTDPGTTDPDASPTVPRYCLTNAPKAPWRLVATRDSVDPSTVEIEWAASYCATRYNVSIYADGSDAVVVVPGSDNTYTATGLLLDRTYAIQVSSRNDAGQGGTSGTFYLRPALPSSIKGVKVIYNQVTGGIFRWTIPTLTGAGTCNIKVKRVSDQQFLRDEDIDCALGEYSLEELDARKMFVVYIRAKDNNGHESRVARMVVGGDKPYPVKSVSAIRDPGDPTQVIVSWLPSDNTGRGEVLGYEVGYGHAKADNRVIADSTATEVSVPADKSVVVIVRVITTTGKSRWSKSLRIPSPSAVDKISTTDQRIDLAEQDGVVTVAATRAVAKNYRLTMTITPTSNNSGFTDSQSAQGGSQTMVFRTVPNGSYLVVVSADGKEMARRYVNVGKVGAMQANEWEAISGQATFSGNAVAMNGGDVRVLSTRPLPTQDAVIETQVNLVSGKGYGLWLRSSASSGTASLSGLSIRYDQSQGKKFFLRQWDKGVECTSPLASANIPSSILATGKHNIIVAAQGDGLYMTMDGEWIFAIPSLATAIANSGCGFAPPTGTRVGLRSWGNTQVTFSNTTVR